MKKTLKDALVLAPKTPVRRSEINLPATEKAVKKIHRQVEPPTPEPEPEPEIIAPTAADGERHKRVTIDIPLSLHAAMKMRTFRDGITLKEYLLDLARRDLKL